MDDVIYQLEEKYSCSIFYDDGFNNEAYWIATPKDYNQSKFYHAYGKTLDELKIYIEKIMI